MVLFVTIGWATEGASNLKHLVPLIHKVFLLEQVGQENGGDPGLYSTSLDSLLGR